MKSQRKIIGVFDSGIGGFSLLLEIFRRKWDADIIYVADRECFPYSTKHLDVIRDRTTVISKLLRAHGCESILIACNTASMQALSHARSRYPDTIFFGTVPAIKPALEESESGGVLLLVTESSAQSEYLHHLVAAQDQNQRVRIVGTTQLVQAIESHNLVSIREEIRNLCQEYGSEYQNVVLGCTHFPLALSIFKEIFPSKTRFFTPEFGIADHMERSLQISHAAVGITAIFMNSRGEGDPELQQVWLRLLADQNDTKGSVSPGTGDITSTGIESS